jgi:hypothetical protein
MQHWRQAFVQISGYVCREPRVERTVADDGTPSTQRAAGIHVLLMALRLG